MKAPDELIIVATFETAREASVARSALEAAGIPAFAPAETSVAPVNRRGSQFMFTEVQVRAADRERALDVLRTNT